MKGQNLCEVPCSRFWMDKRMVAQNLWQKWASKLQQSFYTCFFFHIYSLTMLAKFAVLFITYYQRIDSFLVSSLGILHVTIFCSHWCCKFDFFFTLDTAAEKLHASFKYFNYLPNSSNETQLARTTLSFDYYFTCKFILVLIGQSNHATCHIFVLHVFLVKQGKICR